MKIALYGLPCAGKSTLLSKLEDVKVVSGSHELNRLCGGNFSDLSTSEKNTIRVQYTDYLTSLTDQIILSDGHYSFLHDVVFTEADANVYDVFLYLYCDPQTLSDRYQSSEKNKTYSNLSLTKIEAWQRFEIEQLRSECHCRCKDFYVLREDAISPSTLMDFIQKIQRGYSSYHIAEEIVPKIKSVYPKPCTLYVVDGDKTIINQDSFRVCGERTTTVFDGDFYTGYQSLLFCKETECLTFDYERIRKLEVNTSLFNCIKDKSYIILSAGISELWTQIGTKFGIKNIFADPAISADTKYYVVKLLQKAGYVIHAYGDSKNDIYMLKAANVGYLCIGAQLSKSLHGVDVSGIKLIYNKDPYILSENTGEDIANDIEICKSSSGISGGKLAASHLRLGQKIGIVIRNIIPNINTAILVLERGGRFFGDGLYSTFGGTFYSYHPSEKGLPNITQDIILIVDSVINSGNSLRNVIIKLREKHPAAEIVIATNVIQKDSLTKFVDCKLFAIRTSENSFVGKNQAMQRGNSGPDTADRLFNLIKRPF